MLELIKELVNRLWDFDFTNECLHIIYRAHEYFIHTDEEAMLLLEEIRND